MISTKIKLWVKTHLIPASTRSVDAVQLWEVRWESRHGDFSSDRRPELEAFPSPEEAEAFAQALRDAFMLIKHTSRDRVTVSKAK